MTEVFQPINAACAASQLWGSFGAAGNYQLNRIEILLCCFYSKAFSALFQAADRFLAENLHARPLAAEAKYVQNRACLFGKRIYSSCVIRVSEQTELLKILPQKSAVVSGKDAFCLIAEAAEVFCRINMQIR